MLIFVLVNDWEPVAQCMLWGSLALLAWHSVIILAYFMAFLHLADAALPFDACCHDIFSAYSVSGS